jgi:hypothetical protein
MLSTIVDKYLDAKKGRFYSPLIDSDKAIDEINRPASWNKLSCKGLHLRMIGFIREIYIGKMLRDMCI